MTGARPAGDEPGGAVSRLIGDRDFARFQALIQREAGIWLSPIKKALLVGRLARRLRELGIASYADYYERVVEDPVERTTMLDCISTNETHPHWNLGGTWVPSGSRASQGGAYTQFLAGQGLDWFPHRNLNLLVEALWTTTQFIPSAGGGGAQHVNALLVSPGFRHLIDLAKERELVWGVALPIGVGPSAGQRSLMLYLSFEHAYLGS